MKEHKTRILVIAGPTSSGKSDLAIKLAQIFDGEIISADSRQVYRGMDIGTGKVTKQEQKFARHWLLDVASPTRQYSVARFTREAQKAIRDITRRGKLPIICGGTGFWIDALVYGQSIPDVKPNATLRATLQKLSTAQLFARLQKLDPIRATTIDRKNPVRLIRALEIVITTHKPVPPHTNGSPYEPLYLGISRPFPKLKFRIERRLDARLRHGMVAEVRHLHEGARPVGPRRGSNGVSWKRLEAFGLEYRWVSRYLQGKLTLSQMRDGLLADTIRYAKRQLTWWRKNRDIRWVTSPTQAKQLVRAFLN